MSSRFLLAALALTLATPVWAESPAPEKTLATLIKTTEADNNTLDNLLHGRGNAKFKPTMDYAQWLTPQLIAAIRAHETSLVNADCHGHYTDEICGLDYNPITCAQDDTHYQLTTTATDATHATIEARQDKYTQHYRMKRTGDRWQLDGIACDGGDHFHY